MNSGFMSELEARKVKEANSTGRARWRLLSMLIYRSEVLDRTIVVPAMFETDFASVPRIPMAYWLAGDTAQAAAVVHDYLCVYDYTQGRITWKKAARVFLEAMAFEQVPLWRRWVMYSAVLLSKPMEIWR